MRNVLRTPLTWLIVAEFVVVGTLIVLAWNAFAGTARPVIASPQLQLTQPGADESSPLPDLPVLTGATKAPLPGLNLDSAFWRARLAQLNQDQVYFEQLEWHIVHSALETVQRYVQGVVLPAIERAEASR